MVEDRVPPEYHLVHGVLDTVNLTSHPNPNYAFTTLSFPSYVISVLQTRISWPEHVELETKILTSLFLNDGE